MRSALVMLERHTNSYKVVLDLVKDRVAQILRVALEAQRANRFELNCPGWDLTKLKTHKDAINAEAARRSEENAAMLASNDIGGMEARLIESAVSSLSRMPKGHGGAGGSSTQVSASEQILKADLEHARRKVLRLRDGGENGYGIGTEAEVEVAQKRLGQLERIAASRGGGGVAELADRAAGLALVGRKPFALLGIAPGGP